MKVILLKDVAKVGRVNEVKDVADGFALNSLFPRKLAIQATVAALSAHQMKMEESMRGIVGHEKSVRSALEKLAHARLEVRRPANKEGHLYEAVREETVHALSEQYTQTQLPHMLTRYIPIKTVGEHEVTFTHGENSAHARIIVIAA